MSSWNLDSELKLGVRKLLSPRFTILYGLEFLDILKFESVAFASCKWYSLQSWLLHGMHGTQGMIDIYVDWAQDGIFQPMFRDRWHDQKTKTKQATEARMTL